MRVQTNLVKRGSVYTYRKKVPADLRSHYGKESIRKSLGQGITLVEAKRQAAQMAEQHEAEFERLRQRTEATAPVPASADDLGRIGTAVETSLRAADDLHRRACVTEEAFNEYTAAIGASLKDLRAAYARGSYEPVRESLPGLLAYANLTMPDEPPLQRRIARVVMEAWMRALQDAVRRSQGELIDPAGLPIDETAAARGNYSDADMNSSEDWAAMDERLHWSAAGLAPAPQDARRSTAADGSKLADVVGYWKEQGSKSHRSKVAADTLVREFIELHGDLPVSAIGKGHFVALRDSMLKRVAPATVQARFNLLRAAFRTCMEDDQHNIQSNPLETVKIRNVEPEEKSRDVFSVAQLQTLFDSPVFTEGFRPVGGKEEAAFWAPLLAMFTGSRLNEVLCLRDDAIYQHEGVWIIHFRHRPHLGQPLKGRAKNNRRVPVHPELMRLGLVDYARSVQASGPWLFPAIDRSGKARSHSSAWGAWFGRYMDRIGITDSKVVFHSFRHTFKHHARACSIPEDQQDAMTGHQTGEVARRYGSAEGYPVGALQESMGRLRFGELDLSRVKAR